MPISENKNSGTGSLAPAGANLDLNTTSDNKPVRINSRNYVQTSGDSIGFQAKPAQAANSTGTCWGFQVQPRVLDGFNVANLVGGVLEPIQKGTSGVISGDVQALQCNFSDEGSAGRSVGGDVVGIRFYTQLASVVSGDKTLMRVEESADAWTLFAKLPDDSSIAKTTQTAATQAGWIKVKIGSTVKYLALYNSVS